MAEALVRAALPPGSPWRVASAGLAACRGAPASDGAVAALAEVGCDLRVHRSRPIDEREVREAAAIIALSADHAQQLAALFPASRDRIHLLSAFNPGFAADADVADPFCGDLDDYRHCRDLIRKAVPGLVNFLNQTATPVC